jgi:hypothetical protein
MKMKINLSPSQTRAKKAFQDFLRDPAKQELLISGFAGSGKTFLVKHLRDVNRAHLQAELMLDQKAGWDTYFTATTHKAASVLSAMLGEPVKTIHSLLGLKVVNNYNNGKVTLEPTDKTKPLGKSLLFIDEASMIGLDLIDWIRRLSTKGKTKVVYIGDQYQLPPVKSGKSSPIFSSKVPIKVKLTEIQRQVAGSPIIQLSQEYKNIVDAGMPPKEWPDHSKYEPAIRNVTGVEFQNLVDQKFKDPDMDPNAARVLSWTNARAIAYNKHIRRLYTKEAHFVAGESVMTNRPIFWGNIIKHMTEEIVHISNVIPETRDGLDGFEITLSGGLKGFLPQSWTQANNRAKHYRKIGDWTKFFEIKDRWLDLRSIQSLTVHKSQGSTFKEVFIDVENIGGNLKYWEVARLMYVSVSRASERVYLYGSLPMRKWKDAI